jgi:hypothetical protein
VAPPVRPKSSAAGWARAAATEAPSWLTPVALSAALALTVAVWDPQVRDLAAQTFRSELYERSGFSLWNGTWFGGHYLLSYSVLFPPLAALFGVGLVGAASVIAGAYLFDRLVRTRWGERARPAALWFGAGAATMLASGRLSFALGVAFGLASLRALQIGRAWAASVAALACALASPVAALFLAGVLLVGAGAGVAMSAGGEPAQGAGTDATGAAAKLAPAGVALALVGVLYLVFPGAGQEPFSFSAYVAVPLWCAGALYVTRGKPVERELPIAVAGYLAITTLLWLIPNAIGGNVTRLGALFGGPVLAALLLSRSPSSGARPMRVLAVAVVLAGSAYWQVQGAVRDVVESLGDPSTKRSYYEPLSRWLRAHGGLRARVEVPPTFNHWEAAYLAPDFQLARGWLRQLDRSRNELFYEGELTHLRYAEWLYKNAVRYVALPDSELDYSAEHERDLIASTPVYLRLRAVLADWRVYELRGPNLLVSPERFFIDLGPTGARAHTATADARLVSLGPQAFALDVRRPGRYVVRARWTPYWRLRAGQGCLTSAEGDWTLVRADQAGPLRVSIGFSLARAGRAATGARPRC